MENLIELSTFFEKAGEMPEIFLRIEIWGNRVLGC